MTEVIIIGAGPYGLSLAAHLRTRGIDYRIFGEPMSNWRHRMQRGMFLKSDGYASNLSAPGSEMTLSAFCAQQKIEYADEGLPVHVDHFIAYGDAFQRRFAPNLEQKMVTHVDRTADGFLVRLDDGEIATARRVVMGIGISDFPYLPPVLSNQPEDYVSHSVKHNYVDQFRGREVALIGSGSSSVDLAALLHEAGAAVTMISRREQVKFQSRTALGSRRWIADGQPNTGIGPGWRNIVFTYLHQAYRHLPAEKRAHIVATAHGAAGGWFMRDRVLGRVPIMAGFTPQRLEVKGGRVAIELTGPTGSEQMIGVDHVIACTGYRVDLRLVKFLAPALRERIGNFNHMPQLSRHFETSVPGLYVIGPAAAFTFGPLFRFVYGADFSIPGIARHIAATVQRRPMVQGAALATSR